MPTEPFSAPPIHAEFKSLQDITCDRIRQAIVGGTFEPGERLKERDLAELFGVSTTPVKASLKRLELEGLVQATPLKGVVVTEHLSDVLTGMTVIRAALEGVAASMAAQKASEEDVEALRQIVEQGRAAAEADDYAKSVDVNTRFHTQIRQMAKNHTLLQMLEMVGEYDRLMRQQVLTREKAIGRGFEDHEAIFEAIRLGDGPKSEAQMREHVHKFGDLLTAREGQG